MSKENEHKHDKKPGGLFIPAGILMGMGVGFMVNNVPAGMFFGLGAGFAAFGITMLLKK